MTKEKQNIILSIAGFLLAIISCAYFNYISPLGYDELHAYNIARNLTPLELFTISKSEGHPFLWFLLLMPFAKTNLFFPYNLILLNLFIVLGALYLLYKHAPFPIWLKAIITISAPFLQLYPCYARSYSLTILLLFYLISIYQQRQTKQINYLITLLLLANTNILGIFACIPLFLQLGYENLKNIKQNKKPLIYTIIAATLELLLLFLQFYSYDKEIQQNTPYNAPSFKNFTTELNNLTAPANYIFFTLIYIYSFIVLKKHSINALLFLFFTTSAIIAFFTQIYMGSLYHYTFLYIFLITAFWISAKESPTTIQIKSLLPLYMISFLLIFNPNYRLTGKVDTFLLPIKESAIEINNIFPTEQTSILILDSIIAEVLVPYLNNNITLVNQTGTDHRTLKAYKEILYPFYKEIDLPQLVTSLKQTHTTFIYRTCEEEAYKNSMLFFTRAYYLNNKYCLYTVNIL